MCSRLELEVNPFAKAVGVAGNVRCDGAGWPLATAGTRKASARSAAATRCLLPDTVQAPPAWLAVAALVAGVFTYAPVVFLTACGA